MSTIKITPEQLHHVSTQVEQARQQLEQIRGELTRQIMFVRLMWMGATQERFFYEFERSGSILDKALESMVNTSKELKDIATRFEDADAQSVSLGGAAGAVGAAAMMTNSSGTGSGDKGYRMAHVNFYGRWMWLPVNENGVADQASLQAYEKDQGHLDFNKMQAVNVEPPGEDIFALQIKAFELGIDPFSGRPVSEDYAKWMVISLKAGQIFMGFQMIRGSIPGRQGPLRLPSSHPSVKKMKGYIEEAEQAKRKSSEKAGSANGGNGKGTLNVNQKFPTRLIDMGTEGYIIDRVSDLKQRLSNSALNKSGANFGYMEVSIPNIKTEFYAHSQVNGSPPAHQPNMNYDGFSFKPETIRYPAIDAPNKQGDMIPRDRDTEYKMINDLANKLGPPSTNIKGRIKLFTENDTCISCNDLIYNFTKDYPGIKVEVIHNNDVKIPKKSS
ncbi:WXG100 family type VII secretion target [Paenibacillus tundrae]|uniref:WXG100 family type VII secretion target n=1 Tax=Paenibacillus tundrae TaxID=528187 RepID=A0ABT9W6N7_9BACL|nr:WXG100 family type VII secretion target [Paenibacillus tundrae]MDQ0168909.1 WXG100 family type VII secretion target [Paenibacillus tundrae]